MEIETVAVTAVVVLVRADQVMISGNLIPFTFLTSLENHVLR
jgi:hypothetical protein